MLTNMKRSFPVGALAAALLIALASGAGADAAEDAVARGEFLYRAHCAACHGGEARGDGPVAPDLRTPPSDLTRLRDDGGSFPAEQVHRVIDGRELASGHGSREMPIWGLTFQQTGLAREQEHEVSGRIDDLVEYLDSIQRAVED